MYGSAYTRSPWKTATWLQLFRGLAAQARRALLDHVARPAVALARVVVALAGAVDRIGLQVAPAASAARRPHEEARDADADHDGRDRAGIFPGGVVSASHAAHGVVARGVVVRGGLL